MITDNSSTFTADARLAYIEEPRPAITQHDVFKALDSSLRRSLHAKFTCSGNLQLNTSTYI